MTLPKKLNESEQKKQDKEAILEVFELGQENQTKGNKAVAEVEKKKRKKRHDAIADRITQANQKRRLDDFAYLSQLREAVADYLVTVDPADYPGWRIKVLVTRDSIIAINNKPFVAQKGILAILQSPDGKFYHKGLRPSFDPELDVQAARGLGIYIENTLDEFAPNPYGQRPP